MVLLIGPSGQMHWPTTVKASLQSVSLKWRFSCGQAVIPPPVSLIAGRLRAVVALGFSFRTEPRDWLGETSPK